MCDKTSDVEGEHERPTKGQSESSSFFDVSLRSGFGLMAAEIIIVLLSPL
jgi:hypothetical protein